ncbi:unnamed protein product, partial [Mesorhabditis spiculigera]
MYKQRLWKLHQGTVETIDQMGNDGPLSEEISYLEQRQESEDFLKYYVDDDDENVAIYSRVSVYGKEFVAAMYYSTIGNPVLWIYEK